MAARGADLPKVPNQGKFPYQKKIQTAFRVAEDVVKGAGRGCIMNVRAIIATAAWIVLGARAQAQLQPLTKIIVPYGCAFFLRRRWPAK